MTNLCLHIKPGRQALRITVVGRLDRQTGPALAQQVSAILNQQHPAPTTPLVLDLRCCTAIDEQGARAIRKIRGAAEESGRPFLLDHVPPLIDYVLADADATAPRPDRQSSLDEGARG